MKITWRFSLVLCALSACSSGVVHHSPLDGGGLLGDGADATELCSEEAKFVYVIGKDRTLSSFHPDTLSFDDIGPLICPAKFGASPYSMSVDRHAIAWVVYSSGELFRVDTRTAACTATGFVPGQQGYETFGMGFVSDAAGSDSETLFIGGGGSNGSVALGRLDLASLAVTKLASLNGQPELTGTGDAKLWAFFPERSKVAQLDKTTGVESNAIELGSMADIPTAWAVAFWGGDFWLFLQGVSDSSTSVYRVKPTDKTVTPALTHIGRTIIGAGVSTCAPLLVL